MTYIKYSRTGYTHTHKRIFKLYCESESGGEVPQCYLHIFKKTYKTIITSVLKTSMLQWHFVIKNDQVEHCC